MNRPLVFGLQARSYCLIILLAIVSAGCATVFPQYSAVIRERPEASNEFLLQVDEKVKAAGLMDVASARVCGFPSLRTDRFLIQIGKNLKDEPSKKQWVQLMQQLDLDGRRKEVMNLPDSDVVSLGFSKEGRADHDALMAQIKLTSDEILAQDVSKQDFSKTLNPLLNVPGEYSLPMRVAGFYPLVAPPLNFISHRVHSRITDTLFKTELSSLKIDGKLVSYVPSSTEVLTTEEIQAVMGRCTQNPLGIPLPEKADEIRLVATFAPVIIQDIAAEYDKVGKVFWNGDVLGIDGDKPVVYYYLSHAFFKDEPVFQINYVFWYLERAGPNPPKIEHGKIDGLHIRISLNRKGEPYMLDAQNSCGCYHFFVPCEASLERVVAKKFQLDAWVTQMLPQVPSGERLGVRVMSGWHQVQRFIPVKVPADAVSYDLVPYDVLESLPRDDGTHASMFDDQGVGKGATRPKEEVMFFSVGLPAVGAMRQRGNHATVLVGREYFDDPLLFEKNFVFK